MGQNDVFEFLCRERESGNEKFFSIRELYHAMIDMKEADLTTRRGVWRDIKQLKKYGYVEVKGVGEWPSYIRVKEKYLKRNRGGNGLPLI